VPQPTAAQPTAAPRCHAAHEPARPPAGLLCTRTLYDKEMLQAIRMSNGLGGRPDSASLLTGAPSDVPPTDVEAAASASSR